MWFEGAGAIPGVIIGGFVGGIIGAADFMSNRHRYQGNEYRKEAGLNWMDFHARQYDPQIGRFLGVDPLADAGGQQVFSPYAAMGNDPANMVDPGGMIYSGFRNINGYVPLNLNPGFAPSSLKWILGDWKDHNFFFVDWGKENNTSSDGNSGGGGGSSDGNRGKGKSGGADAKQDKSQTVDAFDYYSYLNGNGGNSQSSGNDDDYETTYEKNGGKEIVIWGKRNDGDKWTNWVHRLSLGARLASAMFEIYYKLFSETGGIMFTSKYGGGGNGGRQASHPDGKPVNVDALLTLMGGLRPTGFGYLGLHVVDVAENTVSAGEAFRDAYWMTRELKDPNTSISEKASPGMGYDTTIHVKYPNGRYGGSVIPKDSFGNYIYTGEGKYMKRK